MYNLITIGDAVIDTHILIDDASVECDLNKTNCKLCLDYAAKIPITDSFQCLGGNSANVAVGAKKLGLSAAIVSALGSDSNAQLILEELKKYGVDTQLAAIDANSKTRYSIVLNYKGERTILSYHTKRAYLWPKDFPETDWIYYTSMSAGFEPFQDKMLNFLEKHKTVRLAFNPGSFQLKNTPERVKEAIKKSDLLILNLEEALQILKTTIEKEKSVDALIHELLILGAKEVVVTDGKKGAWAGNGEKIYKQPSYKIKVVSKTGAGDAFSSGYLSARIYGHDMPTALKWGIANSCGVIAAHGPHKGLLEKKKIEQTTS